MLTFDVVWERLWTANASRTRHSTSRHLNHFFSEVKRFSSLRGKTGGCARETEQLTPPPVFQVRQRALLLPPSSSERHTHVTPGQTRPWGRATVWGDIEGVGEATCDFLSFQTCNGCWLALVGKQKKHLLNRSAYIKDSKGYTCRIFSRCTTVQMSERRLTVHSKPLWWVCCRDSSFFIMRVQNNVLFSHRELIPKSPTMHWIKGATVC